MSESNYWDRFGRSRWSRRRVLGHAGIAGAGLAGLALLSCNRSGSSTGGQTSTGQETPRQGGIISQRIPTDLPRVDVHHVTTDTAVWPVAPALIQLIQYDPAKSTDTRRTPSPTWRRSGNSRTRRPSSSTSTRA